MQAAIRKEQLELIGDLRNIHVSISACLSLMKTGKISQEDGIRKIRIQVIRAEIIWRTLAKEGI